MKIIITKQNGETLMYSIASVDKIIFGAECIIIYHNDASREAVIYSNIRSIIIA